MSRGLRYDRQQRIVVKIGSSSLTAVDGGLDRALVDVLCDQIATLVGQGTEVVLVSSGAVAAGLRPLGLDRRPADLGRLQAAASVGQGALIHAYATALASHGLACGQVLLTPDDVIDRQRYLNARTTFSELLRMGAVPVVNENDTVVTDELRFGDNDRLAALVCSMLGAGLLMLLSDVDGLHDGDPGAAAPVLDRVDDLSSLDARHHGGVGSGVGTGGMASKLEAARIATFSAAHCVIARGRRPDVMVQVAAGAEVGTWFPPAAKRPDSRRLWLAFAHQPAGRLHVDAGAMRALIDRGASLLAIGVTAVEGAFGAGDAVDVIGPTGHAVARGVVAFDSDTLRGMRGQATDALVQREGDPAARPVIHRDQLVVTA
ncbi:MAG: glutamate 5-kinase [Euzebya sp.]